MKMFVFGDSIPYGNWDKKGGWPERLKQIFHEKTLASNFEYFHLLYNLGISGNTTKNILERFEFELKQRFEEKTEYTIIFSVGANDCQWLNDKNQFKISEEDFKKNLLELMKLSQKYSKNIIFLGLTPVDESKTIPIPWDTTVECWNKNIDKYDNIIKKFCKENNILFIDLLEKWKKLNYKELLEDGLHPNTEGHKIIFETIKEELIKNKLMP
jgi:lysophospholipase L1-like esterase